MTHIRGEARPTTAKVSKGFRRSARRPSPRSRRTVRAFRYAGRRQVEIRGCCSGGSGRPLPAAEVRLRLRAAVLGGPGERRRLCKWFKPGKGVFQIRYTADKEYEPDFAVETETEKFLCEPKRADDWTTPSCSRRPGPPHWCKHATARERTREALALPAHPPRRDRREHDGRGPGEELCLSRHRRTENELSPRPPADLQGGGDGSAARARLNEECSPPPLRADGQGAVACQTPSKCSAGPSPPPVSRVDCRRRRQRRRLFLHA